MGEHRLKGPTTKITGKVKEGAGNLLGGEELKREGIFDQMKGKVQNALASLKGAIKGK
jgi:uncharacterized protein YjbJ (UPF0337 family)